MDQRRVSQAEDEIMFVHNYHTLPRIPIRELLRSGKHTNSLLLDWYSSS